ncbi:MAG: Spx/MgsR family RNA polymerase-binding regulatory protein [Proteobacteria bacterium]|jgi:arsenate reductase|nr:Spx/MgsR family RNA polymerase-binding regulatory protein [Pseudomonadota bacterium]
MKLYEYKGCDTCRRAKKFLEAHGISFVAIPIREQPPMKAELKRMLAVYGGDLRRLFNTSGGDYKAMKLSERLPTLTEAEALALLAANGNLVKRPFLLTDTGGLVGFKDEEWKKLLVKQ